MDCIFCKIANGEIDSAKVFEDSDVLAFLDANPAAKGHCLVIPKTHFENVFDISEDLLQKITVVGKHISQKMKKFLDAPAVNLVNSSGKEAGQVVMHFHLHVVPRHENDGLKIHGHRPENVPKPTSEELKELAKEISL